MTAGGMTAAGHVMTGTDPATYQPTVLGEKSGEVGGSISMQDFTNRMAAAPSHGDVAGLVRTFTGRGHPEVGGALLSMKDFYNMHGP